MKDTLTTFEIARLCKVDISTVINWINSGKLVGYKTPGGHRRVRKNEFLKFLRSYDQPIPRGLIAAHSIVIAENGEENRKRYRALLERRWPEAQIFEATEGFSAGKLITEHNPSLMVLDDGLPGIRGSQVCRVVRADRRLKKTRILVLTGNESPSSHDELLQAGADDCLSSPFTDEMFTARVEKLLPLITIENMA